MCLHLCYVFLCYDVFFWQSRWALIANARMAGGQDMTASSSDTSAHGVEDPDDFLRGCVFALLAKTRLPLSPFQLRRQLLRKYASQSQREFIQTLQDSHLSRVCRDVTESSDVMRSLCGTYYLSVRTDEMRRNALITEDYQRLGLTLLHAYTKQSVVAVPPEAEHRFLEARESIIPGAGYGLFLRSSRMLRQGTVLCEYNGRRVMAPPRDVALCPYMVELTVPDAAGSRYIDGMDDMGNILCLAALINDRGTDGANAEFVEYDELPGRVFVTSMRDIHPGEEIYVSYGQSYWDEQAREGNKRLKGSKRRRFEGPQLQRCRRCRSMVPNRLLQLHIHTCCDPLMSCKVTDLDPLPRNEFTAFDDQMGAVQRFRSDIKLLGKRSMSFVNPSDSATYANTHMDVVQWYRVEVIDDEQVTAVD
jgi:hypothetical protein